MMLSSENPLVSIVIPAFNEELGISDCLQRLLAFLEGGAFSYEVLVVNDGSKDQTAARVPQHPQLKLIEHKVNKGYGASLKTGIRAAKGTWVLFFDADGQHEEKDIPRLVAEAQKGYDMVVGARDQESHVDPIRKPFKWILRNYAEILAGMTIPDLNSGLRIVRRKVILGYLHLLPQGFSASTTMTIALFKRGFDVGYLPIVVKKRVGVSTVRIATDGPRVLLLILRLTMLFSPMRLFFPAGMMFCGSGLAYGIYRAFPRGAGLTIGALMLMLMGVLTLFLGLLMDQIAQLRQERFEGEVL